MPDIYQIASEPYSAKTHRELEKIIMMLLGIAVQGEKSTYFVKKIESELDTQIQLNIMPIINSMTSDKDISFAISNRFQPESTDLEMIISNMRRIVDERDCYLEYIIELRQDKESMQQELTQSHSSASPSLRSSVSAPVADWSYSDDLNNKTHLYQYKLYQRKLLTDKEELSWENDSLRDELKCECQKTSVLQSENRALHDKATLVTAYKEELEILRERVIFQLIVIVKFNSNSTYNWIDI